MKRNGFSLIELSIVLVIIGLLVGGLMVGSSLIRNAEVKTVITEFTKYRQAAVDFRIKYGALPGDLPDATSYWSGVANGNGNGFLNGAAAPSTTGEVHQFWLHLATAGMIEGNYTGTSGPGACNNQVVTGTNAPSSAMTKGGWGVYFFGTSYYAGDASNFAYEYGNAMTFGSTATSGCGWNWNPPLKPEEAWSIDTKLDDSMPGAGKVIAYNITTCATATNQTDYVATYRLNSSNVVCGFYFVTFDE